MAGSALRVSYRSLWHRFREGHKESNYEVARRHFKICERACTRLESTGDLSVCYWKLGELASKKQYYSKATKFYEKAINTYCSPRTFSQYQPPLSVIYARYSYAQAGKNHLLPKPALLSDPETQPNFFESEHNVFISRTPYSTQGTSHPSMGPVNCQTPLAILPTFMLQSVDNGCDIVGQANTVIHSAPDTHVIYPSTAKSSPGATNNAYESNIQWPVDEPCEDTSSTYVVVVGSEPQPKVVESLFELEEAVEEENKLFTLTLSALLVERENGMLSPVQTFSSICGDKNHSSLVI